MRVYKKEKENGKKERKREEKENQRSSNSKKGAANRRKRERDARGRLIGRLAPSSLLILCSASARGTAVFGGSYWRERGHHVP